MQDERYNRLNRLNEGLLYPITHNAIKVPHRYAVQVSDTTMLPRAASLPVQ